MSEICACIIEFENAQQRWHDGAQAEARAYTGGVYLLFIFTHPTNVRIHRFRDKIIHFRS